MGQLSSKEHQTDMATAAIAPAGKRKLATADDQFSAKGLERVLEKRRKLEERELSSGGDDSSEFMSAEDSGGVQLEEYDLGRRGTEDEIAEDSSDFEDEQEDEAPKPVQAAKKDMIAQMLEDTDAKVAEIMRGYTSRPIRAARLNESGESGDEDEVDDAHSEGDDKPSENNFESADDTQLVQDSMVVDGGARLPAVPEDSDSSRGFMDDSEEVLGAEKIQKEVSGLAAELRHNESASRMTAVEETVRRIQAERNGGGGSRQVASKQKKFSVPKASSRDSDTEATRQAIAEHRAQKKESRALARQRRKAPAIPEKSPNEVTERSAANAISEPGRQKGKMHRPKLLAKHRKRAAKLARRREERLRAAREDPATCIEMLRHRVSVAPDLPEDAVEAAQREHRIAAKKSRRAELRLRQFEQLVAEFE